MNPLRKSITPGPNQPCLCGSGLKYKKCCASRLPGSEHIGHEFMHLAKLHDVERALLAARADITKYTIWHKSHTARGLFDETPISTESMWRTDVEALADYVERLLRMYWLANRRSELPAVLERLRSNIQSRAWHHKIFFSMFERARAGMEC